MAEYPEGCVWSSCSQECFLQCKDSNFDSGDQRFMGFQLLFKLFLVAEGSWGLADYHENKGEIGKAVKCLEAICQSQVSFFPIVEVKTRLRIATLLLKHSHNVNHAKAHLERSNQIVDRILFQIGNDAKDAHFTTGKALFMGSTSHGAFVFACNKIRVNLISMKLWSCNFNSQLANALIIEGDYRGSISALECGFACAREIGYPELQMFFATSILHRQQCIGLLFYNELLHIFYRLRLCDYKNAAPHVDKLDAAMKADMQQTQHMQEMMKELNALNQSLSRSGLHYGKGRTVEKQARLKSG
ncbi:hypothetical protein K1719_031310 [Acacia pycnantha]|nr:hypothetical protein K1719_031310 [Acacia pycnantha]